MERFFVDPNQISNPTVVFSSQQARQMARVLRLTPGARVLALDNQGTSYEVELSEVTADKARGRIVQSAPAQGEPGVQVFLYQALLKGFKWEYVLQKGTEVGVSAFVPLITQRCVARYEAGRWADRQARWEAILWETAEQSGRGRIPRLHAPVTWEQACGPSEGLRLVLHPAATTSLREALATTADTHEVSLYVGPEGGFTDEEVSSAERAGLRVVGLGQRTLRAETAGLVAASALLYALGKMG